MNEKDNITTEFIQSSTGFRIVDINYDINIEINSIEDLEKVIIYLDNLQKQNAELKEKNEELELQNFNLREDIMIKKMSFPNKEIKDKTFFDLYEMPTYEELKEENFKLKLQKDTNNCVLAILNDKIQKEKERLNNNWNELKNLLIKKIEEPISYNLLYDGKQKGYKEIYIKMKQLEEKEVE